MAWAEDYFDDYALEIHLAEEALREKVDKLTDSEFVSMIIEETKPDIMNNVVRGNRFPAYKVADSCLESGHITPKQRRAITNVYVHAYA